MKMKTKLIITGSSMVIICVIFIFLSKMNYTILNFGNNKSSKTLNEVEEYILNINSYSAQIEVEVKSNKNTNKYIINQNYKEPNILKQEIIEPSNIKGLITTYDGRNLQISNSNLSLSKIYENYTYIADNTLWLTSFIHDYNEGTDKIIIEEKNEIIMEVKIKKNKYIAYKKLHIDKTTNKPTKLVILDDSKKSTIYILYKEIKINGFTNEDILAFKINDIYSNL